MKNTLVIFKNLITWIHELYESCKAPLTKQASFQRYAGQIEWHKIAATGYQESHWNPSARHRRVRV